MKMHGESRIEVDGEDERKMRAADIQREEEIEKRS